MSTLEAQLREALADRYRWIRPLGAGGMAEVFLAEEIRHGRQVAIKALKPELAGLLGAERFQQEIAFAARLNHPNILTLLDSGAAAGTLYYTMPYASGESLRERIARERQLPVVEALRLGEQVARALDYAHREGVIHRDIKPENILLVDRQAMVADFGIARAVRSAGGARITDTGTTIGTPQYMSPEQAAGDRELDGRSDEYSLACVVYEMLAGQPPFLAPTAEAILRQHLSVAPRPVTELRPATSHAAASAILRALAKSPADRFGRAGEFADALAAAVAQITAVESSATAAVPRAAASEPRAAAPLATPPAGPLPRRGGRVLASAIVLASLIVAALAWRMGWLGGGPHQSAAGRQWVLLAEIEGPPEDPSLAPAARDLIGAALDQSTVVATVPRDQLRLALRLAGRPDSSHVTADLARELAYRSSIRVVIEGAIHRLGAGYSTVLRAVDSDDGRVVLTVTDEARDGSGLVESIGRIAQKLRRGLGENPDAIRATRELPSVATPSFEAYRRYDRARRLMNYGDELGSIAVYREAIALDPQFAGAWIGLATAYMNSFQTDSGRAAARRALDIPDRLTEFGRFDVEAKLARLDGDLLRSIRIHDQALALDLTPVERAIMLNNKGTNLDILDRSEEALEQYRAAAALWPIQAPQITLGNITDMLIALGQFPEARAEIGKMALDARASFDLELSLREERLARSESLAVVMARNPAGGLQDQGAALTTLWALAVRRGELARAGGQLNQLDQIGTVANLSMASDATWEMRSWLAILRGQGLPSPPQGRSSAPLDPLGRSIAAALRGDTASLVRNFVLVRPNIPIVYRAEFEEMLRGVANLQAGRVAEAMPLLAGNLRRGYTNGHPLFEPLRLMSRWLVADTFERQQPDSAAAYLMMIERPPALNGPAQTYRLAAWPFVERRLALIEARLGHADEAQRHWLAFSESFTDPDPVLEPWIDETRTTLQASGAMGAAPRK